MSTVVKRQHYVWRYYLRSWSNNEAIWTYLKPSDKILTIGLMGVAQEKYFYKLEDYNIEEETGLKYLIESISPKVVMGLNLDFLRLFTSTSKLKKQLESQPENINKELIEQEIRKLEINLMEIAHGKMENLGYKLLSIRSLDDLKSIEDNDYIFEAIMYICFQYFRTNSIRKSVLKSFQGDKYENLAKKYWNIVSYAMATTLARNVSIDPNLKFELIENKTTNHFLTGDQPVFNILNDILDENGEVKPLEFYYPIAPEYSIRIHFNESQIDKYVKTEVNEDMVEHYNMKVIENSDFYVFSDTKEQLEKIFLPK